MNDGAIVAIVAIVFGCLYATVAMIVKSISGAARGSSGKNKDKDESASQSRDQQELFDLALRLQNRVESLEKLLDTTQPEWRGKP